MPHIEIVFELLITVAIVGAIAKKFNFSLPILLLMTGMLLSFVPGLRTIHLNPDLIFIFFLPPLLYYSAWFISWQDIRFNLRIMFFLAFGLIFATTAMVAFAAHAFVGLGLGTAFILGAILSPTDAIAATAVIKQFRLPKRVVNILEEESLLNDATALVLYSFAVSIVFKDDHFTLLSFSERLLTLGIGGIILGLAVGWLVSLLLKHLNDARIETTISFLVPYAAYLPAQKLGLSGVLAVVSAGIYLGWHSSTLFSSKSRVQGQIVWEMLIFLLNGFIFLITGLQLKGILNDLSEYSWPNLLLYAVIISTVVIVTRIVCVYIFAYAPRLVIPGLVKRDPYPGWQNIFVIGWSGMRGVVSLAAAFAIPLIYDGGKPFPNRDLLLFLTFAVILATLIFQGLTLPWIIRLLKVKPELMAQCSELEARLQAVQAATAKLDEVIQAKRLAPDTKTATRLRSFYEEQLMNLERQKQQHKDGKASSLLKRPFKDIELEVIGAERETVLNLRNSGAIDSDVLHRLEREIDLQEIKILT